MASLTKTKLLVGLSDGSIFLVNVSEALNHRYTFPYSSSKLMPNKAMHEFVSTNTESTSTLSNDFDANETSAFSTMQIKSSDGIAIIQIAVDEMQSRLYIVQEKIGLTRCISFENCDKNATTLSTINLQNSIQYIAVDSWNGYV